MPTKALYLFMYLFIFAVLGIKSKALHMLGKHFAPEFHLHPLTKGLLRGGCGRIKLQGL
jgi:hypothetical protein